MKALSMQRLLFFCGLGLAATLSAAENPVRETLVSDLPVRPYGAVLLDGNLYFSAETQASVDCPAAGIYQVASKPNADGAAPVARLADFECVQKLQVVGNRVFVFYRKENLDEVRLLEAGNWVTLKESTLAPALSDRMAWLTFNLHKKKDQLKDDTIAVDPQPQVALVQDSPIAGKGLNLGLLMRMKSGRYFYAVLPLEDGDKKKRVLKEIEGKPADWQPERRFLFAHSAQDKLLFLQRSTPTPEASSGDARLYLWEVSGAAPLRKLEEAVPKLMNPAFLSATPTGFLVATSYRSRFLSFHGFPTEFYSLNAEGALVERVAGEKDVAGLFPLATGYLVTKGYSRKITSVGSALNWTKSLAGFKAVGDGKLPVPEFPKTVSVACNNYVLTMEAPAQFLLLHKGTLEIEPLANLSDIVTFACTQDAAAVVSKQTRLVRSAAVLKLKPESGEGGIDGGTNYAAALDIKPENLFPELSSANGLLQVYRKNALVLVREPLSGTVFQRVRPRPEPPGFRIWLSDGTHLFSSYLNTVNTDGGDFYVEDVASNPSPEVDAGFVESK
jgi:hypothetical protein